MKALSIGRRGSVANIPNELSKKDEKNDNKISTKEFSLFSKFRS